MMIRDLEKKLPLCSAACSELLDHPLGTSKRIILRRVFQSTNKIISAWLVIYSFIRHFELISTRLWSLPRKGTNA